MAQRATPEANFFLKRWHFGRTYRSCDGDRKAPTTANPCSASSATWAANLGWMRRGKRYRSERVRASWSGKSGTFRFGAGVGGKGRGAEHGAIRLGDPRPPSRWRRTLACSIILTWPRCGGLSAPVLRSTARGRPASAAVAAVTTLSRSHPISAILGRGAVPGARRVRPSLISLF